MSEQFGGPVSVPRYDAPVISVDRQAKRFLRNPWQDTKDYALSLFPIVTWIYRYNFVWLYSDLVAGITTGIVMVPQAMSYAQIAGLPVQYGLYSSFIGACLYALFATSKDVCIGPVAVMSSETYTIIHAVLKKLPDLTEADAPKIAGTLSLLCGGITMGIGLVRLGFLLEYISMPSVLGFMSGSAFTIIIGQIPGLMGLTKVVNSRDTSYLVVVNTLKQLKHSKLDAAFGLVSLFVLFFLKYICEYLGRKFPRYQKIFFYLSNLRNALVIIFSTLISWGVCHHPKYTTKKKFPISLLGTVPSGLHDVGAHPVDRKVVDALASHLPIATIILLLEHIAIAKSFGRINDYRINPNQELIAIGATNLVGHFFQAYPSTGSFSRTALKAKCGVRTPLSGLFTGVCVLVAIYGLTSSFYWISKASLSAVIIHAVVDLIANWKASYKFWLINPLEFTIFFVDILLCVFVSIESGIYFSIAASLVWLLLRISFANGQFLGRLEYTKVNNVSLIDEENPTNPKFGGNISNSGTEEIDIEDLGQDSKKQELKPQASNNVVGGYAPTPVQGSGFKWVPLDYKGINPEVTITPPAPGVFVYRFNESLLYPNVGRQCDDLVVYVRKHTKRDIDQTQHVKLGDRPWNDHGPRHRKYDPNFVDNRPFLRAIVFDLSATPHIDLTSITTLWDTKQELLKYANRDVEFHFVGVLGEWQRRAIVYGGFGPHDVETQVHKQYALAKKGDTDLDIESEAAKGKSREHQPLLSVLPTNQDYFHLDIPDLQ